MSKTVAFCFQHFGLNFSSDLFHGLITQLKMQSSNDHLVLTEAPKF